MTRLLRASPVILSMFLRVLATAGVVVAGAGLLGSGSCTWGCCDCDDDDDGFDDDDDCDGDDGDDDDDGWGSSAQLEQPGFPVDWSLRQYQLIPATEPGAHPVRTVRAIRGFSLTKKLGPGIWGDPQFELFTAQVLQANQDLLGLPPSAGQLSFDNVEHLKDFVIVTYVQELVDADGIVTVVPGAELAFLFNLHGVLVEIEGTLWLQPERAALGEHELSDAPANGR